ncbi:MAG TPA: PqqD family protein [Actinomycetota bacterium]
MTVRVQQDRPLRKPGVWLRQSDNENIVFDPETETVHLLNATAMAIWVLCDGETTPDEMIDAICDLSGLPHDVVAEDVRRILLRFVEADILSWGG